MQCKAKDSRASSARQRNLERAPLILPVHRVRLCVGEGRRDRRREESLRACVVLRVVQLYSLAQKVSMHLKFAASIRVILSAQVIICLYVSRHEKSINLFVSNIFWLGPGDPAKVFLLGFQTLSAPQRSAT